MSVHIRIGRHTSKKPSKTKIDFKTETIEHAREIYRNHLDALNTENGVNDMLDLAFKDIDEIRENLKNTHKAILSKHPELHTLVKDTMDAQKKQFAAAAGEATNSIINPDAKVLEEIEKHKTRTLKALAKTPEEIDALAQEDAYLKRMYAEGTRPETRELFQRMDYLFGVGQNNLFGKTNADNDEVKPENQLARALRMPIRHRIDRWRYMLSIADQNYDLGLKDDFTNHINSKTKEYSHHKLDVLAHLYAQLSLFPRGVDNECMAITHQLRHNPAIHSLHTTALAAKMFNEVEDVIKMNSGGNEKGLKEILHRYRSQVMMMALVHDLGESFGELSTGGTQMKIKNLEAADREKFSHDRNIVEKAVFESQLDYAHNKIAKKDNIPERDWKRIRHEMVSAYEQAETPTNFLGRFFKILERMQSQKDYLRFHGKNGAATLANATPENKNYTLNYVPDLLVGTTIYGKMKATNIPARSLIDLGSGNMDENKVMGFLCDAIEREFAGPARTNGDEYPGLNSLLAAAIGVEPNDLPVTKTKNRG